MSKGFTMVELLLATSLAVLLMTGSLYVVSTLRAESLDERSGLREIEPGQLVEMMRWDFVHATQAKLDVNRITLHGYGNRISPDDASRQVNASERQPVQVDYFILTVGPRQFLARRQAHLQQRSNQNDWTELVCAGIVGLELRPVGIGERFSAVASGSGSGFPLPNQVRLLIHSAGKTAEQKEAFVNHVVTLR